VKDKPYSASFSLNYM